MSTNFRYSICNEVYQDWEFAAACRSIRRIGYEGLEIAPFTLAESPAAIPASRRAELHNIITSEGLEFAGLHWLMVAPKGLHVTTPDAALRKRSWDHIRDLIDLCADLAGDRPSRRVMIFGSPQQRATTGGIRREEAMRHYQEGLAGVAGHAAARGVTILVEALPPGQCDVVNSLEEAVAIVRAIGSPAVRTMFDTHNAVDETEAHAVLVERHLPLIRHVHVNEMDGRYPGTGGYDFKPVMEALARGNYDGWVSLEVFDFTPGAEKIAAESLAYLQSEAGKITI